VGPRSNQETFGIFVLAGVQIGVVRRVKEETTAPHSRLAYIHLQKLLYHLIGGFFVE
jgi:hypothetical protein